MKIFMLWRRKNGALEKPLECSSGPEFFKIGSFFEIHFTYAENRDTFMVFIPLYKKFFVFAENEKKNSSYLFMCPWVSHIQISSSQVKKWGLGLENQFLKKNSEKCQKKLKWPYLCRY